MSGRNRGGGGNKRKKTAGKKKPKFNAAAFWGDPAALPDPSGFETTTPDPVAVVNSLGQPPLPGHGAASPHYFQLVYTRATQLAGALAMAGGLDDLTPELVEEDLTPVEEDLPPELVEEEAAEAASGNEAESESEEE